MSLCEFAIPSSPLSLGQDPTPDSIAIAASARVVLVEGLYLHSGASVWRDMNALFDRTWWVACPVDAAMERVARRHVAAGICASVVFIFKNLKSSLFENLKSCSYL